MGFYLLYPTGNTFALAQEGVPHVGGPAGADNAPVPRLHGITIHKKTIAARRNNQEGAERGHKRVKKSLSNHASCGLFVDCFRPHDVPLWAGTCP